MSSPNSEILIGDLYSDLNEGEQAKADDCLARYVAVVCRIYDRNQNLTEKDRPATI